MTGIRSSVDVLRSAVVYSVFALSLTPALTFVLRAEEPNDTLRFEQGAPTLSESERDMSNGDATFETHPYHVGATISPLAAKAPTLELTAEALTVSSIAPGGSVALFSVAREPIGGISRVVSRHELLVDIDGDGTIVYRPEAGLAMRSIWMIVDLASGAVASGTPLGFPPRPMRPSGAGEGIPVQAVANRLEVGREQIDVLLVRPGVGAWARVVRDGSDADRDGRADGRLRLDPSKLRPIHATFASAPPSIRPGDVLAVLDASRLEAWHGVAAGGDE